ncbi:acyl-CoA N-acyltransferase [Lophiostoma macrostomum CBS 122681]|uniref:Acyl-CoA N-acyltransferase n=1 Tax=Lophiostoma macrostomum CBS 122681 TaxID=1314788 RepID=A0A6A6T0R7_9PLEO|nr:acyl-CoA N-acyltransferase [Lophiostoma macrostomum CBS 122681]
MSVKVDAYNPQWPSFFTAIKARLASHLASVPTVSIEHVGSTSVPDLAAKPIIDIDIIVTRPNVRGAINALVAAGFTDLGELGIEDRHALRDPDQSPPRNIYVCVEGAFQTRNHLAVRDTLRGNAALRDEYGQVKLALAARGTNIVDYVEAKGDVLQKILKEADLLSEEELAAIHAANLKGQRFSPVKTKRLVLREFVMADVQAFYELESIPEMVRYQNWPPRTMEQAREEVVKTVKDSNARPRTHVELAVVHEEKFIGRVGAMISPGDDVGREGKLKHADLWFSFRPESQGLSLATEAMEAFIPLLASPLELEIECDPRNTGSVKMAERLGFRKVGLTEKVYESKGEWVDSMVYQKVV